MFWKNCGPETVTLAAPHVKREILREIDRLSWFYARSARSKAEPMKYLRPAEANLSGCIT